MSVLFFSLQLFANTALHDVHADKHTHTHTHTHTVALYCVRMGSVGWGTFFFVTDICSVAIDAELIL